MADRWCLLQMHSIRNLPSTQLREQQQEDGVEDILRMKTSAVVFMKSYPLFNKNGSCLLCNLLGHYL